VEAGSLLVSTDSEMRELIMGRLKEKQHKKIEQNRNQGEELIDVGKTPTYPLMLSDIDDEDDLVALEVVRQNEDSEFEKYLGGEITLEDVIPDKKPIHLTGPGFDDGTPEELAYLHKKYPNIIIDDAIDYSSSDDVSLSEILCEFADIADSFDRVEEINEDVKRKFKQMVAELEDFF